MIIPYGAADRSVQVHMSDAAGGDKTDLVYSDFTINYRRGAAGAMTTSTSVSLATVATAHTDWGVIHVSGGNYRVDLPDAAWASGADKVAVFAAASGAVQTRGAEEIQLAELPFTYAGIRAAVGLADATLDADFDALGLLLAGVPVVSVTLTVNDESPTASSFKVNGLPLAEAGAYANMYVVFSTGDLRPIPAVISTNDAGTPATLTLKKAMPAAPTNGDKLELIGRAFL